MVKREALFTLCNLINSTASDAIKHHAASFNNHELMPALVSYLKSKDQSVTIEILETLENLFQLDESTPLTGIDQLTYKFELAHGLDAFEDGLLNHTNSQI